MAEDISDIEIICYACGRGENPENTIRGIENCQSINAEWIVEMDIQLTKDGSLVLFHDYNAQRTTGQDQLIPEMTLAEIRKLNAGFNFKTKGKYPYRNDFIEIPEVKSVFERFPKARLMLDIHTNNLAAVDILIELIDEYSMSDQLVIVSHYDEVIEDFASKRPSWVYGVPTREAKRMIYSSFIFLDRFFPIKSDVLMLPKRLGNTEVLTKRVVNHAKKRKREIWAWMSEGEAVKNVDSFQELMEMKTIGVDGVFTDFPASLINDIDASAL